MFAFRLVSIRQKDLGKDKRFDLVSQKGNVLFLFFLIYFVFFFWFERCGFEYTCVGKKNKKGWKGATVGYAQEERIKVPVG